MSVAEPTPPTLTPVVPAKPTHTFASRVIRSALFIGGLGLGVGILEGAMLWLFLAGHGDGDMSWLLGFSADRGIAFGLVGALLGALGGAVRWAVSDRRKAAG